MLTKQFISLSYFLPFQFIQFQSNQFIHQSTLKASAAAWTPTPTKGEKPTKEQNTSDTITVTPPAPVAVPVPVPAPPSVWGKSSSSAIRAAPTPDQQAKITPPPKDDIVAAAPVAAAAAKPQQKKQGSAPTGQNPWRKGQVQPQGDVDTEIHTHTNSNRDRDVNRDNNSKINNNNNKQEKNDWSRGKKQIQPKDESGWQRGKLVPLDLLQPEEGADDAAKAVKRVNVQELLALRLSYVAAPLTWVVPKVADAMADTDADAMADKEGQDASVSVSAPRNVKEGPRHCRWISETRVQEIDAMASKSRLGGDVSGGANRKKKKEDTAPALEDCKPLEVNNETRWKAHVFQPEGGGDGEEEKEVESDQVIIKKGLLILNKLSLTKFDKLSDMFIDTGIGRNEQCLAGAIELIVKKAQDEPHFAAMYAALCLKLSRTRMDFEEEVVNDGKGKSKKKTFKKLLLTECQKEFETDTNYKIEKAIEGVEDEEERQLKKGMVKKHYLGHMRFIGELYKGDLISIKIMLMVLPQLLEGNDDNGAVDEEKVECFAKLMTVIGLILEQQSVGLRDIGKSDAFEKLQAFWDTVEEFAGKAAAVSNRIKFMLQDLLEMRNNGEYWYWIGLEYCTVLYCALNMVTCTPSLCKIWCTTHGSV